MQNQNNKLIKALKFHRNGDLQNAEIGYKMILKHCPNDYVALYYYGLLCIQAGRLNEAINFLLKSIKIKPNNIECFLDLAKLYLDTGMNNEAISLCRNIMDTSINNSNLLYEIGFIFYGQNLIDEALNCFKSAYSYDPDSHNINRMLGIALHDKKEYEQAQIHYEQALITDPNDSLIQHNLAVIYYAKKDFKKGIECFEKAVMLEPNNSDYLVKLAFIYNETFNFEKAIEFHKKAVKVDPSSSKAYYFLGCALLARGEFDEGWFYFDEGRIKCFRHHLLKLPEDKCPKWKGEDISEKTLYTYGVAGHGDSILFARYLPLLHEMGIKVKCKPQKLLHKLFEQSDLKVELIHEDVPESEIECDYQIPMMSFGRIFNTNFDTMPLKNGYLKADPKKAEYFKQKYFNNDNFKVGIVWAASAFDKTRSIPLELFLPIKDIPNVKLYSFQAGGIEKTPGNIPEDFGIINPASEFNTFAEAADAMSNLDLLISVDTATIHVAGALGLKSWVLIPHFPDWRWTINTDKSYLYNSVSLFRQTSHSDWSEIMQNVIETIIDQVSQNSHI